MRLKETTKRGMAALGMVLLPLSLAVQGRAEGPSLSGFVDFGYNYNFNGQKTNILRTFDANANSFTLQNAEIVTEGKTDKGVAYRVDLNYGFDAAVVQSLTTSRTPAGVIGAQPGTLQFDVQQAYLSFPCPLTHGTVTLGKFVTLHGAEVIEAKDDYNVSRGLLFNYAIPLTHTGVKYDKGFMDGKLATTLAVVNGWDNVQDNNKGKSLHGMVGFTPNSKVSLTVGGTYGPEQTTPTAGFERNSRSLVDSILKITPTNKLTFVLNHDWGVEEGIPPATPSSGNVNTNWQGLAAYVNYVFCPNTSGTLRWETFDDEGSRAIIGTEQVLHEVTATFQYKWDNNVISRVEYRQDMSSQKVFQDKNGSLNKDTQSTVALQFIYPF